MTKVLFVCLGNICRSPSAEGVFQDIVNKHNAQDLFEIDSAGTSAHHAGERADSRMRAAAKRRGFELTSISRQFISKDFERFDHIIVMDDSNYQNVIKLDVSGEYHHKVSKMTDYASEKYSHFDEVPDPYYGGEDGFNLVIDLLEDACLNLYNSLK